MKLVALALVLVAVVVLVVGWRATQHHPAKHRGCQNASEFFGC